MSYTVTVNTTTEGSELVGAFLFDMGTMGVNIQDKQDLMDLIGNKSTIFWDYVEDSLFEQDKVVKVTAFFEDKPTDAQLAELRSQLTFAKEQMPVDMGGLDITLGETTNDDSWLDNWKAFYKPIKVGDVTVVPAWEEVEGKVIVKINPSTAFGTGEHESTQMCLKLMQSVNLRDKQVIDVGCGSGILGIAALKMGAKHCYFADIDPDAMRNMEENASLNGIESYTARTAGLLDGCDVVADVMLANITADILKMLSANAADYIKEGGYLIISGIIAERHEEVVQAFLDKGFVLVDQAAMKDWRAYLLRR